MFYSSTRNFFRDASKQPRLLALLFIFSGTKYRWPSHKVCHLLEAQMRPLLESSTLLPLGSRISFENYIRRIDRDSWDSFLMVPSYTCVSALWVFSSGQAFSFSFVLCLVPMLLSWSLSKAFRAVTGGVLVCSPCLVQSGLQYFFCKFSSKSCISCLW